MKQISRRMFEVPQPDLTWKHSSVAVYFDKGKFAIKVPEYIESTIHNTSGISHDHFIRKETFEGVVNEFVKVCSEYDGILSNKHRQKIIAVRWSVNASIMDAKGKKCIFKKDDLHFGEAELALGISWFVGYELRDGVYDLDMKLKYYRKFEHDTWFTLPWTADRQQFFERIERTLKETILKVDNFFEEVKKDPKHIEQSSVLRLLGSNR